MEKLYYVEVTVSGSIAIGSDVAASEDEAREMLTYSHSSRSGSLPAAL